METNRVNLTAVICIFIHRFKFRRPVVCVQRFTKNSNFVNRYTRKLPFLPSNWVRLVMMGTHCLFILTTLSLPSG
ncbi:unnamed protein product [Porites lobata]|uniref:Uncharacterized protein n=1 Tax=Porites lobata TaxID=104759 RepID=A0ABN8PNK2_9CNID|nr:unnamed protein product [Porites lobata]